MHHSYIPRLSALLLAPLLLGACRDATIPSAPTPPSGSRTLGLVEVRLSGIGTSEMHASASVPSFAGRASGPRLSLSAPTPGDGSIQLQALSSGSFTQGTRGAPGAYRYLWATYRVRNAQANGTAYNTARQNLTFFAATTTGTLGSSAISALARFDGSAAAPGIAAQILPTGLVSRDAAGRVIPNSTDVLQVVSEDDAIGITAPAGVGVLPYGFVVRNATTDGRTLPASPAVSQYDGAVTFAFKIPLQASAADDPFSVSAIFLAMDDSETRITQSLEEQTAAGEAAFLARASQIGAAMKTVLPGAGSYAGEAATTRTLCAVRTAGPSGGATAELVHREVANVTLTDPAPGLPLWTGGSVARELASITDSAGSPVTDVPVQLTFGTGGALAPWRGTGVRMLPRRDRATSTVTATACGVSSGTITVVASGISSIGAGDGHSLALRNDGTVEAWGSFAAGQITVPGGTTNVVQVAAGGQHSLALKSDGTVVAWGSNSSGQRTVPAGLSSVVQVSAGSHHSLALRSDGTVVGWGSSVGSAVPAGLANVIQTSAGCFTSMALRSDGTVVTWGADGLDLTPVPAGLTGVVQVAAGCSFFLALRSDGTVVAWGAASGIGQQDVPVGLADAIQITAGRYHGLALKRDGTVVGWGGFQGQRTPPSDLTGAVQVAGGGTHSLALKSDRTVVAWGTEFNGETTVPGGLQAMVP